MLKSRAIILRTVKYKESSVIFDAYTEEAGLRGFIIGGVRKKNAKTSAGMLQIGNIVDLVAYPAKTGSLQRVKELHMAHVYDELSYRIDKMAVMSFCIEVFRKSVKENEENEQVYEYLHHYLLALDTHAASLTLRSHKFLVELSGYIGIRPNLDKADQFFDIREGSGTSLAPYHSDFMEGEELSLLKNLLLKEEVSSSKAVRDELLDRLLQYYRYHVDGFQELKSLAVLRSVL